VLQLGCFLGELVALAIRLVLGAIASDAPFPLPPVTAASDEFCPRP